MPLGLALTAAVARLLPLQWLHPLNWDEIEFFAATKWIGEGRVPFRDFWEHHSPLMWFLFAPFARLIESPGVQAIIAMRWAQIPVWIVVFWLLNVWMKRAGIGAFGRWCAIALALCSSMFMIPAVEYRVDSVACALFVAGMVLVQRGGAASSFAAGVVFCLAGMANLRFGPILVVAVLLPLMLPAGRGWGLNRNAVAIWGGGFAALLGCLAYFAATSSLQPMFQQLIVENRYEKYATPMPAAFLHRMLIPFGVRVLDASRHFDAAGIDVAAIALLCLGAAGLLRAIFDFRDGGQAVYVAALQIANLAFVAWMKFVYNYHLLLVALLMIPFAARAIERVRARRVIVAVVLLGWCVNLFASVLRGKEHDRAYQDLVMREAHARTAPNETFFAGVPWAIHREPAYRLWFLPELARVMVRRGFAERFHIRHVVDHAPAVVVFDYNVLFWMAAVQPELGAYFTRHYVPVWRNLWVPGMNAAIARGARFEWIVPKNGTYRLYVSARLAGHPWFHEALRAASYSGPGLERLTFSLPDASGGGVEWRVDDAPFDGGASLDLKRGQRLTVINRGAPAAVLAIPGDDRVLMRQPPQNVTIEAEHGRVTHVPRVGLRLQP